MLIDWVKSGDCETVGRALGDGAEVDERDERGWTALSWAAGAGDHELAKLLLEHGADPLATGRDLRTPYHIAVAAGHIDAARLLRDAAHRADPTDSYRAGERSYCCAYELGRLRRFAAWNASDADMGDADVVFVHDDLSVTRSMWKGEDVVLADPPAGWEEFCRAELGFVVPDDLDLLPEALS
jgi:uncharacterized protein